MILYGVAGYVRLCPDPGRTECQPTSTLQWTTVRLRLYRVLCFFQCLYIIACAF